MAKIKIKGRSDLLHISNDIARRIKSRWMGDPEKRIERAPRDSVVDLGEWSGEYGQISSIEMDKAPAPVKNDQQAEEEERVKKSNDLFRKQSTEYKARNLHRFITTFKMHNEFKEPSQEILDKAFEIQYEYFRRHPDAIIVSLDEFGDLIPATRSSLADKMKI